MPQYATSVGDVVEVDDDDVLDVEAEQRKQEEALRRFRMKECNILVSNSPIEVGIDSVRYVGPTKNDYQFSLLITAFPFLI